jgi:hypothetical protein
MAKAKNPTKAAISAALDAVCGAEHDLRSAVLASQEVQRATATAVLRQLKAASRVLDSITSQEGSAS